MKVLGQDRQEICRLRCLDPMFHDTGNKYVAGRFHELQGLWEKLGFYSSAKWNLFVHDVKLMN